MTGNENIRIHETLKRSIDHLIELDQVAEWTDEQSEEATAIIHDIIHAAEREKLYYSMYRKLNFSHED